MPGIRSTNEAWEKLRGRQGCDSPGVDSSEIYSPEPMRTQDRVVSIDLARFCAPSFWHGPLTMAPLVPIIGLLFLPGGKPLVGSAAKSGNLARTKTGPLSP